MLPGVSGRVETEPLCVTTPLFAWHALGFPDSCTLVQASCFPEANEAKGGQMRAPRAGRRAETLVCTSSAAFPTLPRSPHVRVSRVCHFLFCSWFSGLLAMALPQVLGRCPLRMLHLALCQHTSDLPSLACNTSVAGNSQTSLHPGFSSKTQLLSRLPQFLQTQHIQKEAQLPPPS